MQAGTAVIFRENEEHPEVAGTVTRVWDNGKYVTIRTSGDEGRSFARLISEVAEAEQSDAAAAADLDATRWDILRAYLADLESTTADLAERFPKDTYYGGQASMLAAIATFMDGQQDGSVTRG